MTLMSSIKKMKQILYKDIENKCCHGGILTDDGDVICGCCGGIQEASDRGITWEIIKEYSWISLEEAICGDDLIECN